MSQKTYVVRAGYNFRVPNDNGTFKTYEAGDHVVLDEAVGDKKHQLEPAKKTGTGG